MAKASLILDTRRSKKDGKFPLAIRLSHKQSYRLISLNIFLTVDQWNEDKFEIKKHEKSGSLNRKVLAYLLKTKEYLEDNKLKIERMGINDLKSKVEYALFKTDDQPDEKSSYLRDFSEYIIKRTLEAGKLKTAIWYKDALSSILKFNEDSDILMQEITVTFLEKYKADCLKKGMSKNSISARLRALRAIMNKAQKEGEQYLSKSHRPFDDIQIPTQKTAKRAVSKEDIQKLRDMELEVNSFAWHARNYFLFMFNMQGMNFVDVAKLKFHQLQGGRLQYVRSKTNRHYDLKLTAESETILAHYINGKKYNDYVFPILSHEIGEDPILISKTCDQALQVLNNNLKRIAKKCGIQSNLTSYVARHSWASAARKLGVSTDIIGDALGHNDYRTTEIYLQEFDKDRLDNVNLLVTS